MQILLLLCKGNWAKLVSAKVEVIDKYVEVSVPLKQTVCFSESGHSIGTHVYLPVACLTGWLVPIVPAPVGHSYTRTVNSKIKNNTAFRSLRYRGKFCLKNQTVLVNLGKIMKMLANPKVSLTNFSYSDTTYFVNDLAKCC